MKIKEGARVALTQPPMILAAVVADDIYKQLGASDGVVITSGLDSKHSSGSLHYVGLALDFRTWNLPSVDEARKAVEMMKEALGSDYDVVLEKDHIHCEFQPKKSYEE